jgi:hypothetical protein
LLNKKSKIGHLKQKRLSSSEDCVNELMNLKRWILDKLSSADWGKKEHHAMVKVAMASWKSLRRNTRVGPENLGASAPKAKCFSYTFLKATSSMVSPHKCFVNV